MSVDVAIVITLLIVYIVFLKSGCSFCDCQRKGTQKKGRSNYGSSPYGSNPYADRNSSPYSRDSQGSLGSVSDAQIWPEKRVTAPNLQRPRLNLHYYPESHPDWDVTQM